MRETELEGGRWSRDPEDLRFLKIGEGTLRALHDPVSGLRQNGEAQIGLAAGRYFHPRFEEGTPRGPGLGAHRPLEQEWKGKLPELSSDGGVLKFEEGAAWVPRLPARCQMRSHPAV
jgi:hypothetical protein